MATTNKTPLKLSLISTKNKLAPRSNVQVKLTIFKNGGRVQKCDLGDAISKGITHVFNGQDETLMKFLEKLGTKVKSTFLKLQPLESTLDITHKFTSRNFDEFVNVMYPIFEASFKKYNLPTTLIQNVLRLAAYESGYGTNPRGALGYNLGGIKWENNPKSRTYKYKHTTHPEDGLEYVDFDNLLDYADYKVYLLNDTYHALDALDTNDFVERLHGKNPSKKSYSDNKEGYKSTLNTMKSLDKAYERYMSLKNL